MNDLTTSLVIDLRNDQLLRGLRTSSAGVRRLSGDIDHSMRQSDRSVSRFSRNARRELGSLGRLSGGVFGKFKGEILAFGSAWAGINILKDSAQLDKHLMRMANTAGVARRETAKMRKEYFNIQTINGITVEQSRLATDKMLQAGLGLKEALKSTRAIADTSAVSHSSTSTIAGGLTVGAQAFGWDLTKEGVASDKLNKMYFAGDLGSAELENLSAIFAKVGAHAKSAGMTFEGTLAFIEQLSKTEQNPEKLATLAESTLRIFNNKIYQKNITDVLGIEFYKKDGSSRDAFEVLKEFKTQWYDKQLTDEQRSNLFSSTLGKTDLDTQRGMKLLMPGNNLANMYTFRDRINTESAGRIERKLPDSIDNAADQMSRLKGSLRESIDSFAMPVNNAVSSAIQLAIDPKKAGGFGLGGGSLLLGGGAALGSLFLGVKMLKKMGSVGGLLGGVAMGEVLEQSMGVTPVYVVNMPSIGFGLPGGNNFGTPRIGGPSNTPRLPSGALGSMFQNMNQTGWRGLVSRAGSWMGANSQTAGKVLGGAGLAVSAGYAVNDLATNGYASFRGWPKNENEMAAKLKAGDDAIAKFMAFFGSETARQTQAIEKALTQPPAKVNLSIKIDQTGRLGVSNIHSPDADVDFDVSGGSMVAP